MAENTTPKLVTKKRINLRCSRPFRIGFTPFSGNCLNIILRVEDIVKIIQSKSLVEEILSTGETIPLNFSNYNTYNGPTDVTDDTPALTDIESTKIPYIKTLDENGHEVRIQQKRRFGGGFRKDPRTTGQISGFHAAYQAEPIDDSHNIVIKAPENDKPDSMFTDGGVVINSSPPDDVNNILVNTNINSNDKTDNATIFIGQEEKKNSSITTKQEEVVKDNLFVYNDTKEVKTENAVANTDTVKESEKTVENSEILQINTEVAVTEKDTVKKKTDTSVDVNFSVESEVKSDQKSDFFLI